MSRGCPRGKSRWKTRWRIREPPELAPEVRERRALPGVGVVDPCQEHRVRPALYRLGYATLQVGQHAVEERLVKLPVGDLQPAELVQVQLGELHREVALILV